MATDKQKAANKENGRKGAGRKTAKGKEKSRMNACKHGLFAKVCLLKDEDPAEFEAFRKSIFDEFMPAKGLETYFTDELVNLAWRIRRVPKYEKQLLGYYIVRLEREKLEGYVRELEEVVVFEPEKPRRMKCDQEGLAEYGHARFILLAARTAEYDERLGFGHAMAKVLENGDLLGKLSRYEGGLRRSYLRTLHELERLQAKRRGDSVPTPVVVDVTVDCDPSSGT